RRRLSSESSGLRILLIDNAFDALLAGDKVGFQPERLSIMRFGLADVVPGFHQFPETEVYSSGQVVGDRQTQRAAERRNSFLDLSLALLGKTHVGKGWPVVGCNSQGV